MITETKKETELAAPLEGAKAELIELINSRVGPNHKLTEKDVFIRSMYLVSDQINSFGGRFDRVELEKMANLVIDCPVIVGHRHDRLPIARNFKAEIVPVPSGVEGEKKGAAWLVTWFYWLAAVDGAENLAKNIDGGINKEVSAAFLFETPECSVCGQDIRICLHIPFRRYALPNGTLQPAFFWYRNVSKILETSLVYRGAVAGTRIAEPLADTKEVFITKSEKRLILPPRKNKTQRIYAGIRRAGPCSSRAKSKGVRSSPSRIGKGIQGLGPRSKIEEDLSKKTAVRY